MNNFALALTKCAILATALAGLMAAPAFAADAGASAPTKTVSAPAATTAAAPVAKTTVAPVAAVAPAAQPTKKPMAMAMSRKRVEAIQIALDNGGEKIAIDGIWGPKTTAAIKEFQKSHNLKATGHLDSETMKALPKSA